jgi:hypothetical protein
MRRFLVGLGAAAVVAGCGSDVVEQPGAPAGAGGQGGTIIGTGGALPEPDPGLASVHAPDQYSVVVELEGDVPHDVVGMPDTYALTSAVGGLDILGMTYDTTTSLVTLMTSKQKLGVEYEVALSNPGGALDGARAPFLSADTAVFWATDFSNFQDYQLTADRAAVGAVSVVYVEQGQTKSSADSLVRFFEDEVYALEKALFTDEPDQDGNGKVLFLGLDGGPYYGGYFSAIDAYPDGQFGVPSNEMEMLYINTQSGLSNQHVIAHEFQHLLYHERHGLTQEDWSYHNEGLAECAVRAVLGSNSGSVNAYYTAPSMGQGLSLVDWQYANFDQYALAYMFWTYLAAQADGVPSYGELFDLATGSPAEVDGFTQQKLGVSFADAQMRMMLATQVRAPSGVYSFEAMETLNAFVQTAPPGTTSLQLAAFSGAFFKLAEASVDYPGNQGSDIAYASIDSQGNVDLIAPFDVNGGVLLVFNKNFDFNSFPVEQSGPNLPALLPQGDSVQQQKLLQARMALHHPPLFNPYHPDRIVKWRRQMFGF